MDSTSRAHARPSPDDPLTHAARALNAAGGLLVLTTMPEGPLWAALPALPLLLYGPSILRRRALQLRVYASVRGILRAPERSYTQTVVLSVVSVAPLKRKRNPAREERAAVRAVAHRRVRVRWPAPWPPDALGMRAWIPRTPERVSILPPLGFERRHGDHLARIRAQVDDALGVRVDVAVTRTRFGRLRIDLTPTVPPRTLRALPRGKSPYPSLAEHQGDDA